MRLLKYNLKRLRWAAALLLLLPVASGYCDEGAVTPEQVKALYLAQLQKFVWVGKPPRSINTICYYEERGIPEEESAGQILTKYVKKKNLPINVKWLSSTRDFSGCDLLYIPARAANNIEDILSRVDSATLTVSSTDRFIYQGGMIGFKLDNANHVKMEGNLININATSIMVDARLLAIMEQVIH